MAKLGDAFSDDQRRESVRRQLQPGAVIYIDVVFPEGRKPKYLVIASVNHECCTFVVNSRIHPFIEANPSLAVYQVRIDAARHPCLSVAKTDETGRLCRMNLAVHGLEGDVRHGGEVNSYYDDPHKVVGD